MGIASSGALWLLWALPVIVLFYLFKRKYADTPVSSHLLWNRVLKDMEANRPWQKLRSRLLMLLQLLAALLIILAAAGLFVRLQGASGGYTVYVLDGSASMLASAPESPQSQPSSKGRTRWDAAKEALLHHAESNGKGSEFALVLLSREPEVMLAEEASVSKLKEALDRAEPIWGTASYRETMTLAAAMAEQRKNARIVFVTDGQWAEDMDPMGLKVPVSVLPVSSLERSSTGIIRFGVAPSGGSFAAVAAVRNWGSEPAAAEAAVYAGDALVKMEKATLAPGKEHHWSFTGLPPSDWYRLELRAEPDGSPGDNTAYAFAGPAKRKTVLLASGGGGNLFLEKALQLAGTDIIKAQKTEVGYAPPRSEVDLVVVDGLSRDLVSSESWTRLLAAKPVWSIRSGIRGTPVKETGGTVQLKNHPVTEYIRWDQVHVSEAVRPAEPEGMEPIVTAGDLPLVLTGGEAGKQRLSFTFGLESSDLALKPDFPILVRNAVDWLTADTGGVLGSGTAGGQLEIPLSPKTASARWIAADGSGRTEEAAKRTDGSISPSQTAPRIPGLYRFIEKDEQGQTIRERWFAAAAEPKESDLKEASDWSFLTERQAVGDSSPNTAAVETGGAKRSYPLTTWLIAAVIAVLVWEWEVYRRGYTV